MQLARTVKTGFSKVKNQDCKNCALIMKSIAAATKIFLS
jgi:hypothetical protein